MSYHHPCATYVLVVYDLSRHKTFLFYIRDPRHCRRGVITTTVYATADACRALCQPTWQWWLVYLCILCFWPHLTPGDNIIDDSPRNSIILPMPSL